MIEETPRIKNIIDEEVMEEDLVQNPLTQIQEQDISAPISESQFNEFKSSRLFMELLICSLLLWSILFIKQSVYERQVVQTIKQVLDQSVQSQPIQAFVEELETAVKQIL